MDDLQNRILRILENAHFLANEGNIINLTISEPMFISITTGDTMYTVTGSVTIDNGDFTPVKQISFTSNFIFNKSNIVIENSYIKTTYKTVFDLTFLQAQMVIEDVESQKNTELFFIVGDKLSHYVDEELISSALISKKYRDLEFEFPAGLAFLPITDELENNQR